MIPADLPGSLCHPMPLPADAALVVPPNCRLSCCAAADGCPPVMYTCSPPPSNFALPDQHADESPPDSPSMPWRPGSAAYPPPSPVTSAATFVLPNGGAFYCSDDSGDDDQDDDSASLASCSKLQLLCSSLCEASYDLSLRDIVEPPFSIHGNDGTANAEEFNGVGDHDFTNLRQASFSCRSSRKDWNGPEDVEETVASRGAQIRSQSHRDFDRHLPESSSDRHFKFGFSFSLPRTGSTLTKEGPYTEDISCLIKASTSILSRQAAHQKPVSLSAATVTASSHKSRSRSSKSFAPSSLPASDRHSSTTFRQSLEDTSSHRISVGLQNAGSATRPRKELKVKIRGSLIGSSNRVHPSSQCSSCASYTIFFKSRCTVCGKLYCSNCARDSLEVMAGGRKCKTGCNARLGSNRFSKSVRSKCWPLCGNLDVSKDPIICKSLI